ncbi:DUF1838 family protein [Blastomonas sp. UPD001]|uniref:DUF1838 family protein n=1 Tax=Blastomonas sp. UPD001 TaxID=2217673 RepID=UPI000E34B86A|nr:DUF1838 family protein [Blastomonas sp. UPD001]
MIGRREALAGLLATGAAGAFPARLFAADGGLDVTSPEGRQRTFMMMRCALDEELTTNWVQASYFGVVGDEMTPLFGVSSAVFSRTRRLDDGTYRSVSFELAWFTDPVTSKAMDGFRNPYTNQDCQVPSGGFQPSASIFGRDLSFTLPKPIPGLTIEHHVLPFVVRGDDVWVSEQMRSESLFPGASRPFRYSDNSVLHARKSDLMKPGATRVTSEVSYTNVVSWRPWLGMGDRPGHLTASGFGRQNAHPDSLPPAWLEATAARKPEVLKDPAAILAPLWDVKG